MLKFKKVKAVNFLSIGEAELQLDNRGLVLIEGINDTNDTFQSNGAGKSTLLSAITYALYGVTPNGLKADALINNSAKKNMAVTLEFEKDGVPYRIERYRKHSKHKNTTKFYQGEVDLTQKSVGDTDKKILAVFGIDYLTYMNSIMYGQGDVEIFAKTSDKGKKQILENLADIEIYRYAQDIAKEKVKVASDKVSELEQQSLGKEQEVQFIKDAYHKALSDYQSTAQLIENQETNLKNEKIALEQLENSNATQKKAIESDISELTKALGLLERPTVDAELQAQIQKVQTNLQALRAGRTNLGVTRVGLVKAFNKLHTETNCYVCGAPLNAEHREKEMASLKKQIEEVDMKVSQFEQAITPYENEEARLLEVQQEASRKYQEVQQNYNAINSKLNGLQNSLSGLDRNVAIQQTKITGIEQGLAQLKQVAVPKLDEARLAEIEKEKEGIKGQLVEAKKDVDQYKILVNEVFSNKGIRSAVLDLVTPFLNERANYYLNILSGADIEIIFSTQTTTSTGNLTDKFDLEVINGSGGSTYQSNSEGEKKRIDLAISFAIQDLVQSKANIAVNFGLYDECFDGLDSVGCENVIKILQERQKEVSSIFVITHNSDLKPLFENVITIKKEQGQSFLVEKP